MQHEDSHQSPIESVLQGKLTEVGKLARAIIDECQSEFIEMKMPGLKHGEEWRTAYVQAIKERSQDESNLREGYLKVKNLDRALHLLQLIEDITKKPPAERPGIMFAIECEYDLLLGRNKTSSGRN